MNPEQLKKRVETLAEGTTAEVSDLTGTENHYQIQIRSNAFNGKSRIDQHKMVYALLKNELETGELHALSIQTELP